MLNVECYSFTVRTPLLSSGDAGFRERLSTQHSREKLPRVLSADHRHAQKFGVHYTTTTFCPNRVIHEAMFRQLCPTCRVVLWCVVVRCQKASMDRPIAVAHLAEVHQTELEAPPLEVGKPALSGPPKHLVNCPVVDERLRPFLTQPLNETWRAHEKENARRCRHQR